MKNKTLILSAIIAFSALFIVSCNKWLDVRPKTLEPATTMFDTPQGYKDALIGCYMKMKSRYLWGERMTFTTVEYLAQHWELRVASDVVESTKRHDYLDASVEAAFQRMYGELYNIIVQANTILEAMPETGETAIADLQVRGVITGEAYAIRAMCHFEILRLFGQIPNGKGTRQIRLPYTDDVSHEPSNYYNYQQFLTKIKNDLDTAAALLREYDPFVTLTVAQVNGATAVEDPFLRYRQIRLNYFAVRALQARFHLYIGETEKAGEAANEVIAAATKGFQLSTNTTANTGDIAQGYFTMPNEGLFMLSNHQLPDYVRTFFPGEGSTTTNLYMSRGRIEGDMFQQALGGTSLHNRLTRVWLLKPDQSGVQQFELRKYEQSTTGGGLQQMLYRQVMPMLRLSEMYLIAMEVAANEGNLTAVNTLYNPYRTARGLVTRTFTTKEDVLEMIELEYRREFFGEGQMFFFYKRHFANSMMWSDRIITETNYIIPLPMTEFDPSLNQ